MREKPCPSCKKMPQTDSDSVGACALCSMSLGRSYNVSWTHNEKSFVFCSDRCLQAFAREVRVRIIREDAIYEQPKRNLAVTGKN